MGPTAFLLKGGLWTSSFRVTRELVGNADVQPPPRATEPESAFSQDP